MAGRLEGKVALVTGSDSGIGQGTAIELAHEGADIVVTYHEDEAGADETRREVEGAGRHAIVVQLDASDEASVAAMFDAALGAFGTLDILVNNAGVDASGIDVADLDTETWDRAIRTNLFGYFFCCRRFIQIRRNAGGGGKIINITSVHDEIPRAAPRTTTARRAASRT